MFFCPSRRRHTRYWRDWSSDVCSSDLGHPGTVRWIEQMETYSSVLELIVLAIIAATIWGVVRVVWNGAWGAILLFGVGVLGIRSAERRVGKERSSRWPPYH